MSRFYISAAHKSSGKTTLSTGIAAILSQSHQVQCFKKGPDYIDPMWLKMASGNPCYNLDFHTMNHGEIETLYQQHSLNKDICIVEGNKGLFDGVDLDGSNSNAAMAKHLQLPVILVIDCKGMTRGIAPLLLGYQQFDPDLNIAGIILNRLGGKRHESKMRDIVTHYTNLPVVGAVHNHPDLQIEERHLGLIPSTESATARAQIDKITACIHDQIDFDALLALGKQDTLRANTQQLDTFKLRKPLRIAVAMDAAFGFYYSSDLDTFTQAGAEIVPLNTLRVKELPQVDALFIGGGFPETQAAALENNRSLRQSIHAAIEAGLPCYAECGGLMYLSRAVHWQGRQHDMVGVIQADSEMCTTPQGRGYMKLNTSTAHPWLRHLPQAKFNIASHEFHYSHLINQDTSYDYAYLVKRGQGITGQEDGLIYKNLVANYTHLRHTHQFPWIHFFLRFVEQCKQQDKIAQARA